MSLDEALVKRFGADVDFIGRHVFGSFSDILDERVLRDPEILRDALSVGVANAGATVLSWHEHHFEPQGFTLLGILAESHVSVHTYPEHRALFFDAFTCGLACDPSKVFDALKKCVGECDAVFEAYERSARPSRQISRK